MRSMRTPVDVIEEHFGEELSPELIQRLRKADVGTWVSFRDDFETYRASEDIRHIPEANYRPAICPLTAKGINRNRGDLDFEMEGMADGSAYVYHVVDKIQQYLLYSDALAIENPLIYHLDNVEYGTYYSDRRSNADRCADILELFHCVKPLIQSGFLCFFDTDLPRTGGTRWSPIADDLEGEFAAEFAEGKLDHVYFDIFGGDTKIPSRGGEFAKDLSSVLITPVDRQLWRTIKRGAAMEGKLDPFCGTAIHEWIVGKYAQCLNSAIQGRIVEEDVRATNLRRLSEMQLDTFDNFSPEDLVAIRQNGTAFAEWRSALNDCITHCANLKSLDNRSAKEVFADRMTVEAESVKKEIKQSSVLSALKGKTKDLTIGAITNYASGKSPEEIGSALATSALSAFLSTVHSYFTSKADPSKQALLQHYMLFTGPKR